jgi:hypothetical protein
MIWMMLEVRELMVEDDVCRPGVEQVSKEATRLKREAN